MSQKVKMKFLNRKAQEVKPRFFMPSPKKAQEEMIGFALIIIIVAVILLVFLSISLNKSSDEEVQSYEVQSFIQSFLQYTSECNNKNEFVSVQDLIFECEIGNTCSDGKNSCDVLNSTLKEISESSWNVGTEGETPVKGYELEILSEEREIIYFSKGNLTGQFDSRGGDQQLSRGGNLVGIYFTVYS